MNKSNLNQIRKTSSFCKPIIGSAGKRYLSRCQNSAGNRYLRRCLKIAIRKTSPPCNKVIGSAGKQYLKDLQSLLESAPRE